MTSKTAFRIFIYGIIALGIVVTLIVLRGRSQSVPTPVPVNITDQYVELDGIKFRYRDEGRKDRPAIFLLHGFSYSLESWDGITDLLKDEYRIVRFDFPGHGLTGPDAQQRYTHADRVENVKALFDHLNLKKSVLVGNSLGGIAAWRYAAKYPDDISKLVLIDPGGFPMNGVTDTPVSAPNMVENYLRKAPRMMVSYGIKKTYADPSRILEGRIDQIIMMMQQPGNGDAMVKIINQFTLPDPTVWLASISAPTLILWGDNDITIPLDHAEKFKKIMRTANLIMLANVGHTPQEEVPALTASHINNFLKD